VKVHFQTTWGDYDDIHPVDQIATLTGRGVELVAFGGVDCITLRFDVSYGAVPIPVTIDGFDRIAWVIAFGGTGRGTGYDAVISILEPD
jgi:hypothetical protein